MIIGNKWKITTDPYCVTISKRMVGGKDSKEPGRAYYAPRWYYNDLKQALTALVDREIQGLESLEHVVERIDALKAEIMEAIK